MGPKNYSENHNKYNLYWKLAVHIIAFLLLILNVIKTIIKGV